MFGLKEKELDFILSAFRQIPEVDSAVVFGSRAIGNYKPASDVDIAIWGDNISRRTMVRLTNILEEELPLPYHFDIIDYKSVTNNELKKHIDCYGKVVYRRRGRSE